MIQMNKNADEGSTVAEKPYGLPTYIEVDRLSNLPHQDGVSERTFWVADIKQDMEVIACCGTKIGAVDRVDDAVIKLMRSNGPNGRPHFIPTDWVKLVDGQVHLKFTSQQAEEAWQSSAASCDCLGKSQH